MRIVCPHDKEIKITDRLGLVLYEHTDNSSCVLMNDFTSTVSSILFQYGAGNEFFDLAFRYSSHLREQYFSELSKKKNEDLFNGLRDFVNKYSKTRNWKEIVGHAIEMFGSVFLDNVDIAAAGVWRYGIYDSEEAGKIMPKFPMQRLRGTEFDKVSDKVSDIAQQIMEYERRKQWIKK